MNASPFAELAQVVGFCTDVGQARDLNEDFVAVEQIAGSGEQPPAGIYVLADGMGGHPHGELASRLAVHAVMRRILNDWAWAGDRLAERCPVWLESAFQHAHAVVQDRNQKMATNMGTTLVAVVVAGHEAYVASVGDSRAYVITPTHAERVTTDHSYVQALVDEGLVTAAQARRHPYAGVLTRAIGTDAEVEVDHFVAELESDDCLLLCSDGLTKEIEDAAIYRIVRAAHSAQETCEALASAANRAGGHDNIAVIAIQFKAV